VSTASGHPRPDTFRRPRFRPRPETGPSWPTTRSRRSTGHVVSRPESSSPVGHASASRIGQLARHTPAAAEDARRHGAVPHLSRGVGGRGLAFFLAFILPTGPERRRSSGRAVVMASGSRSGGEWSPPWPSGRSHGGIWSALGELECSQPGGRGGSSAPSRSVQIVGILGAACVRFVWMAPIGSSVRRLLRPGLDQCRAFVPLRPTPSSLRRTTGSRVPVTIVHVVVRRHGGIGAWSVLVRSS